MSKKSLYAQYMEELDGTQFIEYDWGFVSFKDINGRFYIEDVFIVKDRRGEDLWAELLSQLIELAKDGGYKEIYGSVVPSRKNATWMTKYLFKLGFKIHSSQENLIFFIKEI